MASRGLGNGNDGPPPSSGETRRMRELIKLLEQIAQSSHQFKPNLPDELERELMAAIKALQRFEKGN